MYNYEYTINKEINIDRLTQEIKSSIIVPDFYIVGSNNLYKIYFKTELTQTELNVFNEIVDNHVPIAPDPELEVLKATDKRLIVKPSSRPLFTSGYFTSVDDNPATPKQYGNGQNVLEFKHEINDPLIQNIDHSFNVEGNKTWLFEGYLSYVDALFDFFSFGIYTKATPYTSASNTIFQLQYPYIIPSPNNTGNVTIDLDNLTTLVSVVPRTDTGIPPKGYWDAVFDYNTGKYTNLTPNFNGTGKYNIFAASILLRRYINKIVLLGNGQIYFRTPDPSMLGSNLICRYTFETRGTDHAWKAACFISMYREKT